MNIGVVRNMKVEASMKIKFYLRPTKSVVLEFEKKKRRSTGTHLNQVSPLRHFLLDGM